MPSSAVILVYGAGDIGCYVGGRLAATRSMVSFVGRPYMGEEIATYGLRLTDLRGGDFAVEPAQVKFDTAPDRASKADLILVTVKSGATPDVAQTLKPLVRPGTVVISLQNGLRNAEVLAAELTECVVVAGVVDFNVLHEGAGKFHQGTEGELRVQDVPELAQFDRSFTQAGLPLIRTSDVRTVQWAKLLYNLNNPINALSNVPLQAELGQRSYRRCLSLAQTEALAVLHKAKIRPAQLSVLPPAVMARALTAPDAVYKRVAARVLAMDPVARSSMWEDLERGRKTEIDFICGEVVKLAESVGMKAPVNARLVALLHVAERGGRRVWSGDDLYRTLAAAKQLAGV